MARKRSGLFRAVKSFLKYPLLGASVTLLVIFGQIANLHSLSLAGSPVFAKVPDPIVQSLPNAQLLVDQGREFYEAGQFSEAARIWQQAAQAFKAQGDVPTQAMALSLTSLAYQQLGQWPQATQAITDSLKLLQAQDTNSSTDRLPVLAQALNVQGQLQLAQGQAQEALNTWQQATATYTQAGDRAGITGSLINQVQALQALGLYRQAQKTLSQVQQTLASQPDSIIKAMGLRSLGNTLRVVGDLDQSRQVLQQSLAVAQQLKSPSDINAALLGLGNTARAQQDTQAALKFYQQAQVASTSPTTRTQAQLNQLSLLLETESWSDAQALWPQIQAQLANLPPSRTAVYARINFAQSLMKLGRWGEGERGRGGDGEMGRWGDGEMGRWGDGERGRGGDGERGRGGDGERGKFHPIPLSPYHPITLSPSSVAQLLATAVQQAKSIQDQRAEAYALGHLGGLYEQTQQWSVAQDLTQQALLLAQANNAPDIAYRWQWQLGRLLKAEGDNSGAIATYTQAVTNLQSLRSDLVAINPEIQFSFRDEVEPIYRQLVDLLLLPQGGYEPSQENLTQARSVIESLQLAELDNFFRVACLEGKPVQIDQVIDKDDPTAAVIYPIILPDRLEVILKLPQQTLRHYTIPVAEGEVERTIQELRQKLTKPYTLREVQSLSKQVYDWLIQPEAADLAKNKVKTLVFVLDGALRNIPMAGLYDGQQYLVQKYGVALTPGLQLLPPESLERKDLRALTAGLTEARQGFSALTNVALELNQIKSEVPTTVLLNQEFTSTSLQKQINEVPFPVVHLATHGQFSSQADKTFILAWDKPINVNQLDNLLRATDQSRPGAIELLVLSACQTAAGDNRAALGLAGVAMRAGARSTLASLWSLDDESSAVLMSQFYGELTNATLTKAEALRLAQLALLQNPRYQHPRYWAPFVLVGNWL